MKKPTATSTRYEIVDIVRGLALFGVLLGNMIWTTQWFALTDDQRTSLPTLELDKILSFLAFMLVDFKFYTLFAMLFGLGFAMQLSRSSDEGWGFLTVYTRRLLVLFVIGLAHAFLLWFGDIVHVYALVGFVLILFHRLTDRAILRWVVGLALLTWLLPFFNTLWPSTIGAGQQVAGMSGAERFAALTGRDWLDVLRVNASFMREAYGQFQMDFDSTAYWYLSVLWKFLLGFVIGRRMLLQNAEKHLSLYRRVLPWAATIGLAGNAYLSASSWFFGADLPDQTSWARSLSWALVELSMFALSMAYVAALVILYQKPRWRSRLRHLQPVGRMALTNYLLQSVFLVLLFYGVGVNLLGKVGVAICVALSFVIFGCQMAFSRWWLKRFRFGPMEWI